MSAIRSNPAPEIMRLEVDEHAEMHVPGRRFRLVLMNPVMEPGEGDRDADVAVLNLSKQELSELLGIAMSLVKAAEKGKPTSALSVEL